METWKSEYAEQLRLREVNTDELAWVHSTNRYRPPVIRAAELERASK